MTPAIIAAKDQILKDKLEIMSHSSTRSVP